MYRGSFGAGSCCDGSTKRSVKTSVVEPEPQEPQLFALAEPEPLCIPVLVPDPVPVLEPDLDQDST